MVLETTGESERHEKRTYSLMTLVVPTTATCHGPRSTVHPQSHTPTTYTARRYTDNNKVAVACRSPVGYHRHETCTRDTCAVGKAGLADDVRARRCWAGPLAIGIVDEAAASGCSQPPAQ